MIKTLLVLHRFFSKVEVTDECWIWRGAIDHHGYGRFWFQGRNAHAIRVSYALAVGELSPETTLDHLCRVTKCVNPLHLEPVSRTVNSERAAVDRERDYHGYFKPRGEDLWGS